MLSSSAGDRVECFRIRDQHQHLARSAGVWAAVAQIMLRTWGLTLLGGVLGALLGYGLELMLGQAGWALIGGSMGLCAGALFAGDRATAPPAPAAAQSPAAQPAADDEAQPPDTPQPAAPAAPAATE